jgi:hypothetical protein
MFIAALLTTAELWNQPRCPITNEWIKKMWCVLQQSINYTAVKKNEIMSFGGKWMELEITMLSELSQAQKDKCHMLSLDRLI